MKNSHIKEKKKKIKKKKFNSELKTKPFCSQRCCYIDLNNWLGEKYSIHVNEEDYEKDI